MVLLTGFYRDPHPARRGEFLECLRRNAQNQTIDEIHVLVEQPAEPSEVVGSFPPATRWKLHTTLQQERPTFSGLFAYANARLCGRRVIIANSDIYFDATLRRLQTLDLAGQLLCLSRWDVQPDGSSCFFDHPASQDAWIFEAPIRPFPCDFRLGVPACENRLAWEAERAGLTLSNPSRSVRANHLHLSGIRRYLERHRVPGPTREVPAERLGTPWLCFVVPAVGSLADINETISSLTGQASSNLMIVDCAAARSECSWPSWHDQDISVIVPSGTEPLTAGQTWNCGAMAVEDDDVVCFIAGGTIAAAGLSVHVLARYERDRFLVGEADSSARTGAVVCSTAAFSSIGGFDSTIDDPHRALADLRVALRRANLNEHRLDGALISLPGGGEPEWLVPEITVTREPLATIAFKEAMGFTVARLRLGVSSHNNDQRPFAAVPDVLLGRPFTQAVSCRVSAVELYFLQPGKIYVLVGTDWDGYHPATAWLSDKARKEALPLATTACGTAFEIWSLRGDAGDNFVIPTQVVLVADRLVRVSRG